MSDIYLLKRFALLSALGFCINDAFAQSAETTIEECYQLIAGDSVHIGYSAQYQLMPAACGSIRRQCHLNATGNFEGAVLDYQVANNQLVLRGFYTDNQRNGLFEQYDAETGKLIWRGLYTKDQPTGEWNYWYANGSPKQVVRYEPAGLLLWQCWDEDGHQVLANGNGEWREKIGGSWRGGPVVNGLPTGRWERRAPVEAGGTEKVMSVETFEAGKFRKGQLLFTLPGAATTYRNESRLLPLRPSASFQQAEKFLLGPTCEQEQAYRAAAAVTGQPPQWLRGLSDFHQLLIDRVNAQLSLWPTTVDKVVLWADIDEQGKLHNLRAESPEARRATEWLVGLPKWKPAQRQGKDVPGKLKVIVARESPISFRVTAFPMMGEPSSLQISGQ